MITETKLQIWATNKQQNWLNFRSMCHDGLDHGTKASANWPMNGHILDHWMWIECILSLYHNRHQFIHSFDYFCFLFFFFFFQLFFSFVYVNNLYRFAIVTFAYHTSYHDVCIWIRGAGHACHFLYVKIIEWKNCDHDN